MQKIDEIIQEKIRAIMSPFDFSLIGTLVYNIFWLALMIIPGTIVLWACRWAETPYSWGATILWEVGMYVVVIGVVKLRENAAYPVRFID